MLEGLIAKCPEMKDALGEARIVLLTEEVYQTSDFLVVSMLQQYLTEGKATTFVAWRENYAHYLSLSKKLSKSIEPFLKSGTLQYIECFQHSYCSELPLTEQHPSTYTPLPPKIRQLSVDALIEEEGIVKEGGVLVMDAVEFVERIDVIFHLIEQALLRYCKVVIGGCSRNTPLYGILSNESQFTMGVNSDVSGYGRVYLSANNSEGQVLWRSVNSRMEFSQHVAL